MKRYVLDYVNNEAVTTEVEAPFADKEGIAHDLPNDTEIFLTKSYLRRMNDLLQIVEKNSESASDVDLLEEQVVSGVTQSGEKVEGAAGRDDYRR